MKALFISLALSSTLLVACKGGDGGDNLKTIQLTNDLLPATIALQETRLKTYRGLNQFNDRVIDDSVTILMHAEGMLKNMTDNRETVINTLVDIATQPFAISSSEDITTVTADLTTPPFVIPTAGLTSQFLLLSSSSRFLTRDNTIKTRFITPTELSVAWLRAVEFSNQRCVYVALQSVDANGIATAASNTLVVPLPAAATGECGVQI